MGAGVCAANDVVDFKGGEHAGAEIEGEVPIRSDPGRRRKNAPLGGGARASGPAHSGEVMIDDTTKTAEVFAFPTGEMSVEVVLALAKQNGFQEITVIGLDSDGKYGVMSSYEDLRDVHWSMVKGCRFIEGCSES